MPTLCHHCGQKVMQPSGSISRAKRHGNPIYCNRVCSGLARRKKNPLSEQQKKDAKRLYDLEYSAARLEAIKQKKRNYYLRTRDPEKDRQRRKANMHKHVAYCQRPQYKEWKKEYDRLRTARQFGDFSDAYLILQDVQKEIDTRMERYDIYLTNGTINKAQSRRRAL